MMDAMTRPAAQDAAREFKVGIMVPSVEAAQDSSKKGTLSEAEKHEFDYLDTFKIEIINKVIKNGGETILIAFNDIVESFKKSPLNNDGAFENIKNLHEKAQTEKEVFNLKRYKTLFLQAHKQEVLDKKPNISAQEITTVTNYYWQQYLDGPEKFNGPQEEYDARFPKKSEDGFKHYDNKSIKNYETVINGFADFIKKAPECQNLSAIAGPGNFFNVDKYGVNESSNRAVVGEALDLAFNNPAFIGVCGSEQSFLYQLGLETVGNIKQHDYKPEEKHATSLTVGGTILDSVSRANPDMSEACMKDIVSAIVSQHQSDEIKYTDLSEIIENTKSDISAIYSELHTQAKLPSDVMEALAKRLDISAIEALVKSTSQHFKWDFSPLKNENMNSLKHLVNHSLLYTNTMHTMAIKVSAENLSLLKQHDMVISAISVAYNKEVDTDLDIHQYLSKLSQDAEKLAAKRPLIDGKPQHATIDDILQAHEALKATKDWNANNIELIVKAAERQIKTNYQKNSSPVMVTQYHPEYPTGGNSNEPLLTGAIQSAKHHSLVTAPFKELLSIYDQTEVMRKTTPNYKINTGLQTTMNDLMARLEKNASSLNAGQQGLLSEIVEKYGVKQCA